MPPVTESTGTELLLMRLKFAKLPKLGNKIRVDIFEGPTCNVKSVVANILSLIYV